MQRALFFIWFTKEIVFSCLGNCKTIYQQILSWCFVWSVGTGSCSMHLLEFTLPDGVWSIQGVGRVKGRKHSQLVASFTYLKKGGLPYSFCLLCIHSPLQAILLETTLSHSMVSAPCSLLRDTDLSPANQSATVTGSEMDVGAKQGQSGSLLWFIYRIRKGESAGWCQLWMRTCESKVLCGHFIIHVKEPVWNRS